MAMQPGERLGPYGVFSPIGAGGMGEVYKARDTRLDRTVAIKVLPDHIAQRDDIRARFEREVRAVASLSHPNICSLFDIGEGCMVMEAIDGETLIAGHPILNSSARSSGVPHLRQMIDAQSSHTSGSSTAAWQRGQ